MPQPLTSLVGRESEITAVATLFEDDAARLVTLTGPGGIGKTRLALGVAGQLADLFPDGIWFVSLASITDPHLVVPTIARVLAIVEQVDQPMLEILTSHLRERRALLVLDNFEHVIAASTEIAQLLANCPALGILVTSREPLHLSGEHEYPVPPLRIETGTGQGASSLPTSDAVQLFVERARLVMPDFSLTADNAADIVGICHRLDGLPLALELAAARIKLLSPAELLERLNQPLALLTGGPRDAPGRQQTMRATLQWSYDLLPAAEQHVFRRLSVFSGGWTLAAAEDVMEDEDVISSLASLIDKGLVRRVEPPGQFVRYGMLEPVRQFAWECLTEDGDEAARIRDRHAAYYQSIVDGLRRRADEEDGPAVLDRVKTEHDNLRAALDWLLESGQIDRSLLLIGHLGTLWVNRGYVREGSARTAAVLDHAEAGRRTTTRARVLWMAALLMFRQGAHPRAIQLADEARSICEEQGDPDCLANSLFVSGLAQEGFGNHERARADLERSLPLFREVEDDAMVVRSLSYLGGMATRRGDIERAQALLAEALALARGRRLSDAIGLVLGGLASLATRKGDDERAAELFTERLVLYQKISRPVLMSATFEQIASLLHRRQQLEAAVCLLSVASVLRERTGSKIAKIPGSIVVDGAPDELRAALPGAVFEAAWERGRAMEVEQAVDLARQELMAIRNEPQAAPAALTRREVEVLQLLAAGKSNRQIAEDLFLSSHTVERHVANIYRKIDAHNRAEATSFACSNGLA